MSKKIIFTEVTLEELKEVFRECMKEEMQIFQRPPPTPPPEDGLFTPNQTAKKLGISLPTLSKWKKLGLIDFCRVGIRSIRYKSSAIEKALRSVKKYGRLDDLQK
jgi:hypothetical protein